MDQMIPVTHVHPHVQWSGAASLITPEPWMQDARCAEVMPDTFFPEKGESTMPARGVCAGCPVAGECLGYALRTNQKYGIWAGMSGAELSKLRKAARA